MGNVKSPSQEINDFLNREGGPGILLTVDVENGTLHSEFYSQVHVSRQTVSTRLKEAKNLGLMATTRNTDDHGNATRHILTPRGGIYRLALETVGLGETYRQYVEIADELDHGIESVQEWADENKKLTLFNLSDDEEPEGELRNLDTYPGENVPDDYKEMISEHGATFREFEIPDVDSRIDPNSEERDSSS